MVQRDESGYSMVEVLVAIMILTLAIVPMFTMFDVGLRTANTNSQLDRARALAEQKVELAQSKGKVPGTTSGTDNGLRWEILAPQPLGFRPDPASGATEFELCPLSDSTCTAPSTGSPSMLQVTVQITPQSSSNVIFKTNVVILEST